MWERIHNNTLITHFHNTKIFSAKKLKSGRDEGEKTNSKGFIVIDNAHIPVLKHLFGNCNELKIIQFLFVRG